MVDRYATQSEEQIRKALSSNAWQGRQPMRDDFAMAVDFLENRQRAHTEHELGTRYPKRQSSEHPIKAVTVPLTRRYVTEAADAYAKPVHRVLVDDDGKVDEKATEELARALDEIAYDKHMNRVEQIMVLCRTASNWYQVKRGKLKPTVVLPQDIYPILGDSEDLLDPSDADDYLAYVVELTSSAGEARTDDKRIFAWLSPAETAFFTGPGPFDVKSSIASYENPFLWPQVPDAAINEANPATKPLPLTPLVWWHDAEPIGGLINENDVDVARANLEINVQLSVLFDTIGHQGWGQAVIHAINPDTAPALITAGATQAICLGAEETMEYLQGGAPYESIVTTLRFLVQIEALANRQSPNDFSIDGGVVATSGFSKMVDSLPKLEAREQRTRQLARTEAVQAWPQLGSKLSFLGKLSGSVESLAKLRLRTKFADVKFPESAQEVVTRETHELDKGLVSRANLIAERDGVPVQEVEERLKKEADAAADALTDTDVRPGLTGPGLDGKVQDTALSGVQVTSMVDVVAKVALGELPRTSGVAILRTAFQLTEEQAETIMGQAGAEFAAAGNAQPAPATAQPSRADGQQALGQQPAPPNEQPPGERRGRFADVLGGLIGRPRRGRE